MQLSRTVGLATLASVQLGLIFATSGVAQEGAHPWPTWQRTNSRIGRTETIGPQTPTLAWRLQVDFYPNEGGRELRATLDAMGRMFIGAAEQVTCVDLRTRGILWEFPTISSVLSAPAVHNNLVFFGTGSGDYAKFYCVRAATGQQVWRFDIDVPSSIRTSPAVEGNGLVLFNEGRTVYALRMATGGVAWSRTLNGSMYTSPSLDGQGRMFHSNLHQDTYFALDITDGSTLWEVPVNGYTTTTLPVEDGRLYGGVYRNSCSPRRNYCLDSTTGQKIWEVNPCENVAQEIAMGSPESNTLYAAPGGSAGVVYAFDKSDGSIKWKYIADLAFDPPIVDGLDNIYFGSFGSPLYIWAIRADGTELWKYPMPDKSLSH